MTRKRVQELSKTERKFKKMSKIISLGRKVRRRHLSLGFLTIMKLAKWHLFESRVESSKVSMVSWIINPPSLSILMTVYNQSAEQLDRSINSARMQSGTEIEILIVDDGSTANETIRFLNELHLAPNESLFRNSNSGVVAARNFLLEKVVSDYLIFFDPDDALESDYVETAIQVISARRNVEILYPDVLIFNMVNRSHKVWITGPFDLETLLRANTIPLSSIVSTKLMKMLGGFSEAFHSGVEDWDLWTRAALSGAIAEHLPSLGYEYTVAPVSRSTIAEDNSDLITLRRVGANAQYPFSLRNLFEVFLVVPFFPRIGGVEKYVKQVMSELEMNGIRAALIVTESDAFGYFDGIEEIRNQGYVALKRNDFPDDATFILAIERLAATNTVAINFGSPWAFLNVDRFHSIFTKNVCFVFNTEISLERTLAWSKNFDEFWVAYELIRDSFPIGLHSRVHTMYTGIDSRMKSRSKSKDQSDFTVGFLGRHSPEKGPLQFLEVANVAQKQEKIVFKMAGEGPLLKQVLSASRKLNNFSHVGYEPNPYEFLSTIDCLMIPSLVEGIPLAAMEALSMGVPIVSRNVGGISELLGTPDNGYIWDGSAHDAVKLILEIKKRRKSGNDAARLDPKFWQENTNRVLIARLRDLLA